MFITIPLTIWSTSLTVGSSTICLSFGITMTSSYFFVILFMKPEFNEFNNTILHLIRSLNLILYNVLNVTLITLCWFLLSNDGTLTFIISKHNRVQRCNIILLCSYNVVVILHQHINICSNYITLALEISFLFLPRGTSNILFKQNDQNFVTTSCFYLFVLLLSEANTTNKYLLITTDTQDLCFCCLQTSLYISLLLTLLMFSYILRS